MGREWPPPWGRPLVFEAAVPPISRSCGGWGGNAPRQHLDRERGGDGGAADHGPQSLRLGMVAARAASTNLASPSTTTGGRSSASGVRTPASTWPSTLI